MAKTNEFSPIEPATSAELYKANNGNGNYSGNKNNGKLEMAQPRGEAMDVEVKEPRRRGRKRGSTNANRALTSDVRRRKRETEVSVGERIRHLRTEARLSQEELGRASKMSTSYISRLETGEVNPTVDALTRIVRVFGLTIDGLLELNADSAPQTPVTDELDPELRVLLFKLKGRKISERTKKIIQVVIQTELDTKEES